MDLSCFANGFAGKQALILVVSMFCLAAGVKAQLKLPSYSMNDYPLGKPFANPNQIYHFAYNCLRNQSDTCPELNGKGQLNVTSTKESFCGDCSNQIRVVLRCIDIVKDDFMFENKASTDDVRTAIDTGCGNGNFTITATHKSVGTKVGVSLWTFFLLGMMSMLIL